MEAIIFTKNYAQPPVNRREILRYMRCTDAGDTFDDLLDACLAELRGHANCTYPRKSAAGMRLLAGKHAAAR